MILIAVLFAVVVATNGQVLQPIRDYPVYPYYDESPKPYAFSYSAPLEDGVGQSSRTETADGTGKVEGSYSLTNDEGHTRVVDYIADQHGFRASIRTNEPGTDNKNPADVVIQSAGPYSDRPVQYGAGIRRPIQPSLNAIVQPVAPEPVEVPENIIAPVRRTVYRRPQYYANRPTNYAYRTRNLYNRY